MISIAPRIIARLATSAAVLALLCGALPAAAAPAAAPSADPVIKLPLQPTVPAAQRTCTARTASGLGYVALKAGEGAKPTASDVVLVNYIGYIAATGQVFDQNMQTPFPVGNVIPGFTEGLQLMARGGVQRLCIPAALGYGAKGAGADIPPNADLVFQVELLDFKTQAEIAEMRRQQEAAQAAAAAPAATPAPPAGATPPHP
ncbi:FKBP-type peptidyl-prolyl cis-trans isomerase [Novosphingobium sp. FKTRR1]|uniref:FKBP-type peptidyl-prolyl cis-trans isomerase n=1 Tax=Novosphingobium sp. FKTRR1 TaxID=2879118 RepID=UPI001CF02FAE|nr:FKBP-type peptidyl-prolyl cis-trans isomerase [Novosphingobium sp. FKTRR1]